MKNLQWALTPVILATATVALAQERWKHDPRVLACSPQTLHAGETLRLSLGPGHGKELSIGRASDGTTYVLVVGSPPEDVYQLMTTAEFGRAKSVQIPSSLSATPWTAESRMEELVFTTSGRYQIFVSESLESERGGHTCQVKFIATPR